MTSIFLTAFWRKLIMAQYEVDPITLAPWLPRGVELDLWQGRCYVSLVGFLFDRVRVKGLTIPFHMQFEEINLRFYVVRTEVDGTRKRGVVFIREFVSRPAITLLASALYEEPYATLPTRHSIVATPDLLSVSYAWRHRAAGKSRWHSLAVEASPIAQPVAPGGKEEFVTEHYWGYTKRSRGNTSEYGVLHPRWPVYPIRSFNIDVDFAALYGPAFASLNHQVPVSVLIAEGSEVSVHGGTRLLD
jgi:uncharacterized protein YqjF (DUF2071 family)